MAIFQLYRKVYSSFTSALSDLKLMHVKLKKQNHFWPWNRFLCPKSARYLDALVNQSEEGKIKNCTNNFT